jgi:hypothetical protein
VHRTIVALTLVGLVGCGGSRMMDSQDLLEHSERFVGMWLVDQPTHATYEATFYDLQGSGDLLEVHSIDLGGHLQYLGETGRVTDPSGAVSCLFGSSWHSRDDATLVILGECSDDFAREIVLGFQADASANAGYPGATVKIGDVGGEVGWQHAGFEWAFHKCPADADPFADPFEHFACQ